jgi:D-xylose transport system permease protein
MTLSIPTPSTAPAKRDIRRLIAEYKIVALLLVIAVIWAFFGALTYDHSLGVSEFLTARNFSNLLRQMAITGMLASGMVFVIIAAEIDLSVGSLSGLLGGVAAVLDVWWGWPLYDTIAAVVLLGIAAGLMVGWIVAYVGIPSFIVTLGGMLAFRGAVLGITGGITIAPVHADMRIIGQGYLPGAVGNVLAVALFVLLAFLAFRARAGRVKHKLPVSSMPVEVLKLVVTGAVIAGFVVTLNSYQGVPVPVMVLLVILGVFTVIGDRTVFGRRIYAVGSNLEATRLSGVNVNLVKMLIWGLMGLMCAFAGLTTTARLAAGTPSAGFGAELDCIASCFIGGASMRGGIGTVIGALVGAMIMASLDNGMSMLGIDTFWQQITKGIILVAAVWLDIVTSGAQR